VCRIVYHAPDYQWQYDDDVVVQVVDIHLQSIIKEQLVGSALLRQKCERVKARW